MSGYGIEGETQEGEKSEGADEGHGHCQRRDYSGPPALEEDEDHEDDENKGFMKGLDDLFQTLTHRLGGIQGDDVVHIRRKGFLGLLHELFYPIHRLDGVGARELIEGQDGASLAIKRPWRA